MVVSLGLLAAGYYEMYYEPYLESNSHSVFDMYEGVILLTGAVGFAVASKLGRR